VLRSRIPRRSRLLVGEVLLDHLGELEECLGLKLLRSQQEGDRRLLGVSASRQ
jgi:transcriptional regulator of aromatic amino acid metabolism